MCAKRLIAGLLSLFFLLSLTATANTPTEQVLTVIADGAPDAWLVAEAGGNADWYAFALAQSDTEYDLTAYAAALAAYLSASEPKNAVARQRCALLLLASGSDSAYPAQVLSQTFGTMGIMSRVFGLHLAENGVPCETYTKREMLDSLLALQLEDGGWAISGKHADVDVTAMVLQAIAPEKDTCPDAVERALALLEARQLPSGGFASYGAENAESVCQVLIALTALGIDPTDARFCKNGRSLPEVLQDYRLPDGTYSHVPGGERSDSATAQALLADTAICRYGKGLGSLYRLDAVYRRPSEAPNETESDPPSESRAPVSVSTPTESDPEEDEHALSTERWVVIVLSACGILGSVLFLLIASRKRHTV